MEKDTRGRRKDRKLVSLPREVASKLARLKGELESMSGRTLSLGAVIERAVDSLLDRHSEGAWLSPAEMREPLKRRVREAVVANVIAMRDQAPELGLGEIRYDAEKDALLLEIAGRSAPVGLYPDSPHLWTPPRSG